MTDTAHSTADKAIQYPVSAQPKKVGLKALAGLFPFLAPYKRQLLLAGIALLTAAGATLAIPYAFRQMIDLGFGAGRRQQGDADQQELPLVRRKEGKQSGQGFQAAFFRLRRNRVLNRLVGRDVCSIGHSFSGAR